MKLKKNKINEAKKKAKKQKTIISKMERLIQFQPKSDGKTKIK